MRCAFVAKVALVAALGLGGAARAEDVGAYLAGRAAGLSNDYAAGVTYFEEALAADPDNPFLLASTVAAHVGLGEPFGGLAEAQRLSRIDSASTISALVVQAAAFRDDDYDAVLAALDDGHSVSPLVDGLARAWAQFGRGEVAPALAALDALTESDGLQPFAAYHKALVLAAAGDYEQAEELLSGEVGGGLQLTRRGTLAQAQILGQLGRPEDGAARIDELFGPAPDPELADLRDRLRAGEQVPYDFVATAAEGMAEVYFDVAAILSPDADPAVTLVYARLSEALDPGLVEATLMAGALLDRLERYDLAVATYATVPAGDPFYFSAEMGRADALYAMGREQAAVEAMGQLARILPEMSVVQAAFADILRRSGDFAAAEAAYSRAIELSAPTDRGLWLIHFTRGISRHRTGDWTGAEADLRRALELSPSQAQVLNYLGYSLIERGEKLDEAMSFIEDASRLAPDNGAIVDSLGWARFTLGDYEAAVVTMEQAAALEPVDPVVNDHLGDAYWAVGRQREARFQWQRALSFGPEPEDAERIRRKLSVGLDAVRAEEGLKAVDLAQDG